MECEGRRNKIDGLEKLNCLDDNQFRFCINALSGIQTRKTLNVTRNLFTYDLTEEQIYFKITEEIVNKLGGIEEVEKICCLLEDFIPDTKKIRDTLKIEPFTYTEEPRNTISRNVI